MAWAEQAWRHSLAGLPDPSQADTEQQFRLSLAGVANASDLYVSTGLALDYDDALSFHAIPEPSALSVTQRYALGNVPTIGLSDSINRDGALTPTLDGFTVDFDGTRTLPVFDGALSATLGGFGVLFERGTFEFRHYFDISYSITPTWVVHELPANFGDIDITLGGFTTSLTGFALPPDSTQGLISSSLSGFTVDFDGTYAAPPTFTGQINLAIESFGADFDGTVFASGTTGALNPTLDGFTTELQGSFAVWSTDGTFNSTLDEFSLLIEGQFIDAAAITGTLDAFIGGFNVGFTGFIELPRDIETIKMRVDTPDDARMYIDTPDKVRMKL